jgi:hypothetical protein
VRESHQKQPNSSEDVAPFRPETGRDDHDHDDHDDGEAPGSLRNLTNPKGAKGITCQLDEMQMNPIEQKIPK